MKALEGSGGRWFGPVDESDVVAGEEELGVPLPSSYRSFLLEYGSGIVGRLEIYGLGTPRSSAPNLLWLIDDLRKIGLRRPAQLIPFYAEGDGDFSAILAAPLAGHPTGAVVYWSPRPDDSLDLRASCASLEDWFDARLH